MDEAES